MALVTHNFVRLPCCYWLQEIKITWWSCLPMAWS